MALAAALAPSVPALAASPALNSVGQSGGLVVPYAFVLPEGVAEAQYNDYIDPRYGAQATGSEIYWGAVGLLPYVEVSGGMANYPANVPASFAGSEHAIIRHLMANIKVEVPQFFRYQPAIAFGMTDIGGQTHYFRSKYGVVSQRFGPATFTAGYGQGDRLDGPFGGAELSLWKTGLSLLVEDDSKTPYAGVRYQSPQISWLADASVIATLMRALHSTDGVMPRTSFSVGVQIPLGKRFDAAPSRRAISADEPIRAVPSGVGNDTAYAPVVRTQTASLAPQSSMHDTDARFSAPVAHRLPSAGHTLTGADDPRFRLQKIAAAKVSSLSDASALDSIARQLFASGLERVRVGVSGHDLIVEYENHRYNQNEADALGVVLGVASVNAPEGIERVHAVIKKAGEAIGEVVVDRDAYARFIATGDPNSVGASLTMHTRPTYDAASIAWHGDENRHGLTRIEIQPVTSYLFGTEYGQFDVSLGVNVAAYVPLWTGAELYGSYIAPFYNTKNMDNGRVFSRFRLRNGLSSVALAQSFWIAPRVLNVAAIGRFDFDYVGVENETTMFVPGRPDLVRLRLAYLHEEPGHSGLPGEKNAELTYRFVQPAWKLWVEAGVARFVGGDKGPEITFTRWFDDVSFSVHAEHSGQGSFVGAAISFPLTPRQGMKPGFTQVAGASQFSSDFRTRVGETNYIENTAAENLSFPYSTQAVLLNRGRFSAGYFATQLNRMRDAYERYAHSDRGAASPALQAQASGSAASVTDARSVCANFFQAIGKQTRASAGCN